MAILLVDDDRVFRERLKKALERRGFDVRSAGDPGEARTELARGGISRALLDLSMPGEGGLSLLRSMRIDHPAIEAVVLTGYESIATALEAIRIGARDYLTKPASLEQILKGFGFELGEAATEDCEEVADIPSLSQVEWDHIQRVLQDCDGNITQAAKLLGVHRRSLQRKLQKLPGRVK